MEGFSILQRLWSALTTLEGEWGLSFFVFIIEITVLVIGIPAYLRWREFKKWQPLRQKFPWIIWSHFENMERELRLAPKVTSKERREDFVAYVEAMIIRVEQETSFRLVLLNPAITAEISRHIDGMMVGVEAWHRGIRDAMQHWDKELESEWGQTAGQGIDLIGEHMAELSKEVGIPKDEVPILFHLPIDVDLKKPTEAARKGWSGQGDYLGDLVRALMNPTLENKMLREGHEGRSPRDPPL